MNATLPTVGQVFWKLGHQPLGGHRIRPAYIRHEVRALVDDVFVFRRWSLKRGWVYTVEPVFLWWLWLADIELDETQSSILLDPLAVRAANKKLRCSR